MRQFYGFIFICFIVIHAADLNAQRHRNFGFFNRQSLELFVNNKTMLPVKFSNPNPKLSANLNYSPAIGLNYHHRLNSFMSYHTGLQLGYETFNLNLAADVTNVGDTAYFSSPALKIKKDIFFYQIHSGISFNHFVNRSGMLEYSLGFNFRYLTTKTLKNTWRTFALNKEDLVTQKYFELNTGYNSNRFLIQLTPAINYRFLFQSKNFISIGLQASYSVSPATNLGAYTFYMSNNNTKRYGKVDFTYNNISLRFGYGFTLDNISKRNNYLRLLRSRDNYNKLKWRNDKQKLSDDEVLTLDAFTLNVGYVFLGKLKPSDKLSSIILSGKPRFGFKFGGEFIRNQKAPFDLVYGASLIFNNYNATAKYKIEGVNPIAGQYQYQSKLKLSYALLYTGLEFKLSTGHLLKPLFRAGLNYQLNIADKFSFHDFDNLENDDTQLGFSVGKSNATFFNINPTVSIGTFYLLANKDMISVRLEYQHGSQDNLAAHASISNNGDFNFASTKWSNNYVAFLMSFYFNKSNRFSMVRLN